MNIGRVELALPDCNCSWFITRARRDKSVDSFFFMLLAVFSVSPIFLSGYYAIFNRPQSAPNFAHVE